MDWEWIGKGLIYRVKWVFLKLLGKLRGKWLVSEIVREGKLGERIGLSGVRGLVNWGVFGK